jgi:lipid II:glycine glycyltransferase (peptidoglycan interpeptide bridge formation enzyme)
MAPGWLESAANATRIPLYLNFCYGNETVGKAAGLIIESDRPWERHLFFYAFPALHDTNTQTIQLVIKKLIQYAAENGLSRLIVRSYDRPIVFQSDIPEFIVSNDHEYLIDLTPHLDEIQKRFNRLIRRKIKKAKENKAVFFEGQSPDLIDKLVMLMNTTKSVRMSKGYQKYSYFYLPYLDKNILHKALIKGAAKIFYVTLRDNINSILFVLTCKKRAYALLLGTDNDGYQLGIPAFLYFSAISRLKELGFESFSLGRVPNDSSEAGLVFFKESLGAEKVRCAGGSTNFLNFPYKYLNPLMYMGRRLPDSVLVRLIKRFL